MPAGRLILEQAVRAQDALARAAAVYDQLDAQRPVAIYATSLTGDAIVLGRYQRPVQALADAARKRQPVLRRLTGGTAVFAGEGVSYLALALHTRSALMACPAQRILNRNVRGALQGLRGCGVPANYFGRDFVAFEARPGAYVGWDAREDGRVLLEFFLCQTRSCWLPQEALGYPARTEDPLRGRTPTSLAEAGVKLEGQALLSRVAQGYAQGFGVVWERETLSAPPPAVPLASEPGQLDPSAELRWSYPREEAIGFVSAGVLLDAAGKIAAVQLAGDFFAHRACAGILERMLTGVSPSPDHVGRAVDAAYAQPNHDVEGIRNLRTIQESILDAVAALTADREAP